LDREQPTLTTARLRLRPFVAADATTVERLAGDPRVAGTTINIPHPYPIGGGSVFIAGQAEAWRQGSAATWAIVLEDTLIGCVGLPMTRPHQRTRLGYWIDPAEWNHGYATEAARAAVEWAFADGFHRVEADHLVINPASGRVMQKIGMRHEGRMRGYYLQRSARFVDVELYAILRDDR
jgi:RimJ/RimL family protein N-acetyltransferase